MSLVDPGRIPGLDVDVVAVRDHAASLAVSAAAIQTGGSDIVRAWQRLPGSFQATGAESVYDVMAPVGASATLAGDALSGAVGALLAYADRVEPIVAALEKIHAEATAFVAKAKGFHGAVESIATGYTLGVPQVEQIDSWDQDPTMTAKNDALIHAIARLEADWLDAQQTCASAIRAAAGLGGTGAATERAQAHALRDSGNISTPWGDAQDRKESCSEKANTFGAHFIWDGVIVHGLGGLLQGVGALTGTWDGHAFLPWEEGEAVLRGDWSRYLALQVHGQETSGQALLGLAHLASGAVVGPLQAQQWLDSPVGRALPSWLRGPLVDWNHQDGTALYGTALGLVGLTAPTKWWDGKAWTVKGVAQKWIDDPGGTAGGATFDIGTFFIPGAGEVAGGAKVAGESAEGGVRAAEAASEAGSELGDLADAGGTGLRGLDAAEVKAALGDLDHVDTDPLSAELARPDLGTDALHDLRYDDLAVHDPHPPDGAHPDAARPDGSSDGSGGHHDHAHPAEGHDAGDGSGPADHSGSLRDHDDPADDGSRPGSAEHGNPPLKEMPPLRSGQKGAWNEALYWNRLEANARYVVDDGKFVYETDDKGRVVVAEGHLDSVDKDLDVRRHGYQQRTSGGADRLPGDQGSHYFGNRFGGPGEGINLAAMLKDINLREFKRIEDDWASTIRAGGGTAFVDARFQIRYGGDSLRPDSVLLISVTDEGKDEVVFDNLAGAR